ncbi:bark storage protein A-like isoform X2 [Herrania umbratica]|uniref:Bark storage protein A-like isoform X2 n=1 Tax=Herrania umbratica TaxID=108875 RepID=A0A6J0ZRE1_9ROSI|nr:bark storage protein A-like isoform X2 [Herrania umbratica]
MIMTWRHGFVMLLALVLVLDERQADGAVSAEVQKLIHQANLNGPYVGLVIPNLFELSPLLRHPNFTSTNFTIPFSGRRFRFGIIGEKRVILVMTGLSLINAGITTQLLLTLFKIEGVVHYGIAGNANPSLNIGDVTIPQYWSQTSLWYWQRYGDGPLDELALESNGDYTREIGLLKFANFTTNVTACPSDDNLLNNVWYQPEEVFPIDGAPEQRQHAFWVPVDSKYFRTAKTVEDLKLEGCLNSTACLDEKPKVVTVQRGTSGSIFLDNAAYRSFIYSKFNVSPVDMESASLALICLQQRVPFIIIRALSNLAGGGSAESNEIVEANTCMQPAVAV